MEILLTKRELEEKIWGEGLSEDDKKALADELDLGEVSSITEENIGPGADVMIILIVLAAIQAIKLGKDLNDGVDGWIELGKKLSKLVDKKEIVAVDKDGATSLAIKFISDQEKIESIRKDTEHEINLASTFGLIGDNREPDDLISKPYNYYVQSFIVNDEKIYVLGVKSSGEVNLIKCFEFGNSYGIREM
jgi:hypothetical protein